MPLLIALALGTSVTHATCWQSGEGEGAVYRHPSVSAEYKEAPLVVIGRTTSERNVSSADDPEGYDWTIYEVEVLQTFKGRPLHTIRLLSENSSARFLMDIGKSYLLFVSHSAMVERAGQEALPQDHIDNCGNSDALDTGSKKVEAVRRLSESH
jgi:hypothetical protein